MPLPDDFSQSAFDRAYGAGPEIPDATAIRDAIRAKIAELSALLTRMESLYAGPPLELDDAQGFLTEVQSCVDTAIKNEPDRAMDRRNDAL